jgi:APA family basic amino acid/polyamine antiporter
MNTDTSPTSQPRLLRALGPLMATAVVVGCTIGSGVFKKPQAVAEAVPNFGYAALAWVLMGVLALLGGLTVAEVAVLYPRAGGPYVFLREAYGRLAGFLYGWVEFWIIRSASIAALATIFSESLFNVLRAPAVAERLGYAPDSPRLAAANEVYMTGAVILGLALVNVRGVKWGGALQLFITLVKVGSLLAIMALPFLFTAPDVPNPDPLLKNWVRPPESFSLAGFATALLAVLWAYHGWLNGATVAGEVKEPQRNVPLSLIGGVAVIITLYLGANFAYAWVIPQEQVANVKDTTTATVFSERLLGPVGAVIMSAVVMCSVFGALNGNILVGPRILFALGEDGVVPRALGRVHPRYHTPALAILVLAAWSVLLVAVVTVLTRAGSLDPADGSGDPPTEPAQVVPGVETQAGDADDDSFDPLTKLARRVPASLRHLLPRKAPFDVLTDFAMFGVVIFETMAVLAIFVFRRRYPNADRPYRCWGYPATPVLYALLPALILVNMFINQRTEALAGTAIIGVGALVYAFLLDSPPARPLEVGGGPPLLPARKEP